MNAKMMGWGAILVGILIALTQYLGWAGSLHYLWALLVLVWGAKALMPSKSMAPPAPTA